MRFGRSFAISAISLVVGGLIGFSVHGMLDRSRSSSASFKERREGQFRHINPLLACDIGSDADNNLELGTFRKKVEDYLRNRVDQRRASTFGVYYRDLNGGAWFSIGESERFVPASLRKVPLMIALLRQSERERSNLLDRLVPFQLSRDYNENQNIKPAQTMVPGKSYAVRDLIYRMIVFSDNNAFTLLTTAVNPAEIDEVYTRLRLQNPGSTKDDQFLSVQTYASFFRILYNATYLTKDDSEWALEVLSNSDFRAGIVEGVPGGIPVAHKFGEHSDDTGTVQLHDCGIIYHPKHPYLLCVMTKGPNFESLDEIIAQVSRIAYSEVNTEPPPR